MSLAAIIVIIFGLLAQAPTTFDLSADFSFRNNPNKVWQYGYSATNSLAPDQFRVDTESDRVDMQCDSTGSIGFWHPAANNGPGPGYYPYVAYNTTKQSQVGCKGWAVRAGEVAMEASNTGQYSLVRFVAPVAGTYKVSAQFEGVHFGLSTTDVHVLHNGTSLFDADIDGYGGDPAFHKVEGANPTASYSGQVELKANDTVTLAVGYGKDKTNSGDTTGLFARVVLLAGAPGRVSQLWWIPTSASTMPSAGTALLNSATALSGRIGTASESSGHIPLLLPDFESTLVLVLSKPVKVAMGP